MSIKPENKRITITIPIKDYNKIKDYAMLLKMHPSRLMNKIIHMYCNVELEQKKYKEIINDTRKHNGKH